MVKTETNNNKFPLNLIVACSIGTVLEWYDFSLYAYFAPILSSLFFPSENPTTSIILTYSVFAIGFFARPIGAILFGHFGDRLGRKNILIFSMIMIATTTSMIGMLPTYKHIGISASVLLVILRVLQGVAIGGEATGAGAFVIESMQNKKRGLATSLIWSSSGVGILLSSVVVAIVSWLLNYEQLSSWGWRLPFLFGILAGILGYYLRYNTMESVSFKLIRSHKKIVRFPLMTAIKKFPAEIFITAGLYVLSAIITYLVFVYMPIYAYKIIGLPYNQTMAVNNLALTCTVLLVPLAGYYSDRVGRRKILLISSASLLLFSYPLYVLINYGTLLDLVAAQLMFAILASGFQGAITITVLEMFPVDVRFSASAFGYNLSYSMFGGTAPLIAIYLVNTFQSNASPGLYLSFGALIALVASYKVHNRNSQLKPLNSPSS